MSLSGEIQWTHPAVHPGLTSFYWPQNQSQAARFWSQQNRLSSHHSYYINEAADGSDELETSMWPGCGWDQNWGQSRGQNRGRSARRPVHMAGLQQRPVWSAWPTSHGLTASWTRQNPGWVTWPQHLNRGNDSWFKVRMEKPLSCRRRIITEKWKVVPVWSGSWRKLSFSSSQNRKPKNPEVTFSLNFDLPAALCLMSFNHFLGFHQNRSTHWSERKENNNNEELKCYKLPGWTLVVMLSQNLYLSFTLGFLQPFHDDIYIYSVNLTFDFNFYCVKPEPNQTWLLLEEDFWSTRKSPAV